MLDLVAKTAAAPPLPDRSAAASLVRRLHARTATVAVVGLGHVGLPLALATAAGRVPHARLRHRPGASRRLISAGESPLGPSCRRRWCAGRSSTGLPAGRRGRPRGGGRGADLRADAARPATASRTSPMSRHDGAGHRAGSCGRGSSSCWNRPPIPAPRAEVVQPILEATGLQSRQRLLPRLLAGARGSRATRFGTAGIPKVVGGADAAALRAGRCTLYGAVVERIGAGRPPRRRPRR